MTDPSPTQSALIAAYGVRCHSLDRWVRVRMCIAEIQAAVTGGTLGVAFAAELARLSTEAQAEVFALGLPACRAVARELRALRKRRHCPKCRQPLREHE